MGVENENECCQICSKPGSKKCSACHSVSYCSVQHQKEDWKRHKPICSTVSPYYEIRSNETFGRYTIARTDIPAGTIIMNEPALVIGPRQETLPVCLGCNKSLLENYHGKKYYCSKCRFPLCGVECENAPIHAHNECRVFSNPKLNFEKIQDFTKIHPLYECLMSLRCLCLKDSDPSKWRKLVKMTDLNEIRKQASPQLWLRNSVNTVSFIRDHCLLGGRFTEEDIHSVLGYVYVNAFEVKCNQVVTSGLFDNTCIMPHSCEPNTHHSFTEDYHMVVRSTVPIRKGQMITTTYTDLMKGTLQRHQDLKDSKFFDCSCPRCSDPTEMGTYFSGLKCPGVSCPGYLLPDNSLLIAEDSRWTCSKGGCPSSKTQREVMALTANIQSELEVLKGRRKGEEFLAGLEGLLDKYRGVVLHPNHFLVIEIERLLLTLYGRNKKGGWSLSGLERKEQLSRHVLSVVNVFQPGFSRIRGMIMYELNAAIYLRADKLFNKNEILGPEFKRRLEEVIQILESVQIIFSFDCGSSSEGRLAKSIPTNIQSVKESIRSL